LTKVIYEVDLLVTLVLQIRYCQVYEQTQKRKDNKVARRSFQKLLEGQQAAPIRIVTDKLRSYLVAMKKLMPSVEHSTQQYENN
jgi:transposase-like protein